MEQQRRLEQIVQEFMALAAIPRPSHHEAEVGAYLSQWALDHGLSVQRDDLGDVILDKPPAPGCEAFPRVILQAHMDMVCVAEEGRDYDPLHDPIEVINDGKTLTANGTSLGADDGIGVAICLHILQDNTLRHGPLRVIFTVNEEDGMDSIALPEQYLDAQYLINLDWEQLGSLCNSSAGCDFITLTRPFSRTPAPAEHQAVRLELTGLLGGHSGVDINRGRANALVCMATLLLELKEAGIPFALAAFHGGQARNAIPTCAEAILTMAPAHTADLVAGVTAYRRRFDASFGSIETGARLSWTVLPDPAPAGLDCGSTDSLLSLLVTLPNNVNTMSPFAPGLVESSQNLGLLTLEEDKITLSAMGRSCAAYRAGELLRATRLTAEAFGFTFVQGEHAPAWAVNPNSRLTPLACAHYHALTGQEMVVEPVHGGLECGAFSEKNPALDMIAIGPTLRDVHTPKESCDLESVAVTAALVVELLEALC